MNLRRRLTATLCAGLVLGSASAAQAGGSDSPTPYRVTVDGIYLPEGTTFPAHGHVNWRTTWAKHDVHFDPNNGHPGAQYIGKNFLAWPHPLEPGECITWVQISMYNEHFGEGRQDPVCSPTDLPTEEPTEDPTWTETPEPTEEPTDQPTDPEVEPEPITSPPPTDQPEPSTPPSSGPSVDPSPSESPSDSATTSPTSPPSPTEEPTDSSPSQHPTPQTPSTTPRTTDPGSPVTPSQSYPSRTYSTPSSTVPGVVAPSQTSVTPATTATGTSCADHATPIHTLDRNLDADGDGLGCEDNLAATGSSLVGKVTTTSVLILVGGALVYGSIIRRKAAR